MGRMASILGVIGLSLLGLSLALAQNAPQNPPMTFFLTSEGPGEGSDLGGLAGADAHCQRLAAEANAGNRTWRAYLSTQGPNAVNARDRIGTGPWHNARGVLVGQNVEEIHGMGHRFTPMTVLDEKGRMIPGGEYAPNPDGLGAGRHGLSGWRRHDLQQLDEQQYRKSQDRSS